MSNSQQQSGAPDAGASTPPHFNIQLDREHYKVLTQYLTGEQIRALVTPPVPATRDLFEVVPSGSDRKIGNEDVVQVRSGIRFFTAPAQINPGT